MKRSDVRAWLHQAALDVARLAEPRQARLPEGGLSVTCAGHESFFDAEREARALAWLAGATYVVVEVRAEDDPPGVQALFVVCTDESVDQVPCRREVVFRTDLAALHSEAAERALRDARLLANRALQILDQGCDQAMHDVLWELERSLRAADSLPAPPDDAASASPFCASRGTAPRPVEGGPSSLAPRDGRTNPLWVRVGQKP